MLEIAFDHAQVNQKRVRLSEQSSGVTTKLDYDKFCDYINHVFGFFIIYIFDRLKINVGE